MTNPRGRGGEKIPTLDLFSGIGAYSLGMERSGGFRTVAFCENNSYCQKILKQHWADVPCYDDVTTLTGKQLNADGIFPRWIVAGWPCQDISVAGSGSGLDGARSGLWEHIPRLARETGAEGLLLENSSNLLAINGGRDFGRVLADLAALGMHVEWHCLPAAAFDAPHIRDRLWIVATLANDSRNAERALRAAAGAERERIGSGSTGARASVANTSSNRRKSRRTSDAAEVAQRRQSDRGSFDGDVSDANGLPSIGSAIARQQRCVWEPESGLVRVASGIADRMDRLKAIGNCNPPIIAEALACAILSTEAPGLRDEGR